MIDIKLILTGGGICTEGGIDARGLFTAVVFMQFTTATLSYSDGPYRQPTPRIPGIVLCCDPNKLYLKDSSHAKKNVFALTFDSARDLHHDRGRGLGMYWACQVNKRHPAGAEQAFNNTTTMSLDLEINSP